MKQTLYQNLELDRVLAAVSQEAGFADSKQAILQLEPQHDFDAALAALTRTKDAYELVAKFGTPCLSGVRNVGAPLQRAKNGGNLSLGELLTLGEVLRNIRALSQWHEQCAGIKTSLDDFFSSLYPNPYFEEKIFTCILSEDTVADQASETLARIRREIRRENQLIRQQLDRMIRSHTHQKHLQDAVITQRDGRFVIPVKQEYRSEVDGLVHDTSSSGATLFIEPTAVVEANNRIRILESRERDEILRIIAELSEEAAGFADAILLSYDAMTRLDVCFAMANYAYRTKSVFPKLNREGRCDLRKARHPLIDPQKVVPIDLRLGTDFSVLVITGPNTGGKTVALKTLGLLSLMAMCGLMIPAQDDSEVSVYDAVYADIGDEQSIEQSLSTFSAHMVNIVEILKCAGKNSLVLLDEVGAGTDPTEGAALAVAILEKLRQLGTKTAATTHYAEMKQYALETDGVENAGCEFDVATLRPTYRLLIGVPGKSNAFAISRRLGLGEELIEKARASLSGADRRFEETLEKLEKSRSAVEEERAKLAALVRKNKTLSQELEAREESLRAIEQKAMSVAQERAKGMVDELSKQAVAVFAQLERLKKLGSREARTHAAAEEQSRLRAEIHRMEAHADPVVRKKNDGYRLPRPLCAGDSVRLADLGQDGIIIAPPDSQGSALVQVGVMKMRVPMQSLILVDKKPVTTPYRKSGVVSRATRAVKTELDIRGADAVQGVSEVERFLDDAVLSGLNQVTIIHGKGTGVLRKAVQDRLKTMQCVKSYRNGVFGEGEMGVTVVELK